MEYETLWALGPFCGVDRLDAIIKGMELTNYYGMDAISAGVIAGFAMDCFERGLLSSEEVDGIDAKFGNADAMVKLVDKIGKREGVGLLLADGVKVAAEKIGKGSDRLAAHIKGVETTGYDLRALKTAALGFAVSFRGADHNRHGAYAFDVKGKVNRLIAEKGRGKLVRDMEDVYNLIDSFVVCKFSRGTYYKELPDMAKLYTLVTGIEMTAEDLKKAGERIQNVAKLFNLREGLTRKDDTLPWKVMHEPIPDEGPSKGAMVTQAELDLLLDDYYESRGWTKEGVPTVAKLKELGMDDLLGLVEKRVEA
jgi:aldehyde:ferredoxin oxidoreductase